MSSPSGQQYNREDLDRRVFEAFQRHKFGRFDEAFAEYTDVLRIMPEHEDALHYMGLLAQQSGKSEDATKLIRRSLELRPGNPDALNHLGQVYIAMDAFAPAEQCFRQALAYDRNHFHAINNLANCFKKAGRLETAVIHYERALAIEPRNPICLFNLGTALSALGRHWDAIEYLIKATQYERRNYIAHHKLGMVFEQLGKFGEAQANFIKALEYCPTYYDSLAALLNSAAYETTDAQAETARQVLRHEDITEETRIRLEHALGKYHDKKRSYAEAFEHFRKSNEVQKSVSGPFDIEAVKREFDRYIDFYSSGLIRDCARFGSTDERPVFVVGLPRTGTSLTEQILSSHSMVYGAGELKAMQHIASRVDGPVEHGGLGGLSSTEPPLNRDAVEHLCRIYLDKLTLKAPGSAIRIVDKFPMNCLHLGLIATLFPKAKIIHCQRDPLDVAISCYTVLFKMGNDFTNDLRNFGLYYHEHRRLMNHWLSVLPTPVFELSYERLVQDPELGIRQLVEYCGLPWEDACLAFDENERAVRTPSNWQVRQKLYSSSIGRWRNYEAQLAELTELLAA